MNICGALPCHEIALSFYSTINNTPCTAPIYLAPLSGATLSRIHSNTKAQGRINTDLKLWACTFYHFHVWLFILMRALMNLALGMFHNMASSMYCRGCTVGGFHIEKEAMWTLSLIWSQLNNQGSLMSQSNCVFCSFAQWEHYLSGFLLQGFLNFVLYKCLSVPTEYTEKKHLDRYLLYTALFKWSFSAKRVEILKCPILPLCLTLRSNHIDYTSCNLILLPIWSQLTLFLNEFQ